MEKEKIELEEKSENNIDECQTQNGEEKVDILKNFDVARAIVFKKKVWKDRADLFKRLADE